MNPLVRAEILKLAEGVLTRKIENFDYALMLGQD